MNSVQIIIEYKFHMLCQLQRSAEVSPLLFQIFSNFFKVKKVYVNFFFLKWRNESDVLSNIKNYVGTKGKDVGLVLFCTSISFIVN